jgi:elongation factor G
MKAYWFDGDNGEKVREGEIPANLIELCKEKKLELIQSLAEIDEEMEGYFLEENIDVPTDLMKATIRKHTISLNFAPVLMGSAFKNKGV